VPGPAVDLVLNCFERTYRDVLAPGFFPRVVEQNRFAFARRVVLINNVDDLDDARARADALIARGELTDALVVSEHLDAALAVAGLTYADIARAPHYTNCALVGIAAEGSPWLCYWDADVRLHEPIDWITPSVDLLRRERRALVANPNDFHFPEPQTPASEVVDGFALAPGFSDQLFLARRADLARPIYRERSIAAYRNPLAHITPIFEARLDSYMRHHGLLRASHLASAYVHPSDGAGVSYPGQTRVERFRRMRNQALLAGVRAVPRFTRPPALRDL